MRFHKYALSPSVSTPTPSSFHSPKKQLLISILTVEVVGNTHTHTQTQTHTHTHTLCPFTSTGEMQHQAVTTRRPGNATNRGQGGEKHTKQKPKTKAVILGIG